jgi:glycolate oxidase iron-sulfur subunit
MQTQLDTAHQTLPGREAAELIRSCVHCGFCNATCPTYQLLGDELDGPRGRIHLIKQMLEGEQPGARTQRHLDRCLTCRACETTCPSGVQYGRLLDIGRQMLAIEAPRPIHQRWLRRALAWWLTGPWFAPALHVAQWLRPLLPERLAARIPARQRALPMPDAKHSRRVLLLTGCVQPALAPTIDIALARVFDAVGIELRVAESAGCCGAIRQHLGDADGAGRDMRRNVDAWWPEIEAGVEAIVVSASGCGTMLADYANLLRDDARYATKAARISALARDPVELLAPLAKALQHRLGARAQRVVYQAPCSQQHGLRIRNRVEPLLEAAGAVVLPHADGHLCCGSAGTYSLLQSGISRSLRSAKLSALQTPQPEVILSANIGCIHHLAAGTQVPVMHWIEWLAGRVGAA